jgi:hypothetical protein
MSRMCAGESDATALVLVAKAKEDQEGQGRWTALSVDTTQRLRQWLTLAGITEGAMFRRCPRSNQPDRLAERMHDAKRLRDGEVARIYKRRATAVGLKATGRRLQDPRNPASGRLEE